MRIAGLRIILGAVKVCNSPDPATPQIQICSCCERTPGLANPAGPELSASLCVQQRLHTRRWKIACVGPCPAASMSRVSGMPEQGEQQSPKPDCDWPRAGNSRPSENMILRGKPRPTSAIAWVRGQMCPPAPCSPSRTDQHLQNGKTVNQ